MVVVVVMVIAHHMLDGDLVSTAESFAVGFALLCGQVRISILLAVLYIGPAVIVEVFAGSFDTILKSLTSQLIKFIWRRVPRTVGSTHAPVVHAGQVRHAYVVSAAKAFAICAPHVLRNIGMAVFLAIVDIGTTMVTEVLVSSLDTVMKAAPLHVVPLIRRSLPVIAILRHARGLEC